MEKRFSRTGAVLGKAALDILGASRVAVFGLGGVGGFALEALARAGVGTLDIIDSDTVDITNINRQLIALSSTVGKKKTEVFAGRIADINPMCKVNVYDIFYLPEAADRLPFDEFDYVLDAIDTVTAKIDIAVRCQERGIPVISSMGTGNKLDPTALCVDDIYSTSVCPLARVMRYELKKRNIKSLKVVYSKEKPITPSETIIDDTESSRRQIPGSTAFVPSVAGLIIAGEVIKDLSSCVSIRTRLKQGK